MNAENERLITVVINNHLKRNTRPAYLKRLDQKLATNGLARNSIQRRSVAARMNKGNKRVDIFAEMNDTPVVS